MHMVINALIPELYMKLRFKIELISRILIMHSKQQVKNFLQSGVFGIVGLW